MWRQFVLAVDCVCEGIPGGIAVESGPELLGYHPLCRLGVWEEGKVREE